MAKKKTGTTSPKALVKPGGWPEVEIPNDLVLNAAQQYREATVRLFRNPHDVVLPLYTLGSFAIELYLKSLNAKWIFEQESIDPDADPIGLAVTAKPSTYGHVLGDLFDALHRPIQIELESTYKNAQLVERARGFRDALANYEGTFEKSRYSFEHTQPLPKGSLNAFVELVQFLGEFVNNLPKRVASCYEHTKH